MPPRTHEQTINVALGEVLQSLGRRWVIHSEEIGQFVGRNGRPDLLIETADGWATIVEAEVGNHAQAEAEARDRIGDRLTTNPRPVDSAVALVYPEALRNRRGAALRDSLRSARFEYALFTATAAGQPERFPERGWLSGGIIELALLLHRCGVHAFRVDALADVLETGVNQAAGAFSLAHPLGSPLGLAIADHLKQSDDAAGQTRKMAMVVIVNALVFHEALSQAGMLVPDPPGRDRAVRTPRVFRAHGAFLPTPLVDEWDRILSVNYWPIFHTAGAIVRALPTATAASLLDTLWRTAEQLVAGGVTRSHDLTGVVFQRLIADRKYLATFYTRPAAAALLTGLAVPIHAPLRGARWDDADSLGSLRIGDFACGTGTLLSTAYQRLGLIHEASGGDPATLHPLMMRRGLVGLDVLNVAVHLTAAMLAGSYPSTPFDGECLLTMPYGSHAWGVCVGSLDLLESQTSMQVMQAAALTAGGLGEEQVRDHLARVGHNQFDLVIMNPPFTRHGAREGDRTQTHNPAFAAFEATEEEQDRLAARLQEVAAGGAAHGHAGLASFFADLAHRKVSAGGRIALVLPLSSMSGMSWDGIRRLWRAQYSNIIVATIAERGSHTRSFSADTGMAECLITATKQPPQNRDARAVFAILDRQPRTTLEGELTAQAITAAVDARAVRRLEDGPFGGTRIALGDTQAGTLIDCPLPLEGAWQMVGIDDFTVAQTANQLSQGRLWIEGMAEAETAAVPIATIGDICQRIGPHDLDITGAEIKADGLPQGPFERVIGNDPGAAYPCLWNHESSRERRLVVSPDSHCQIRAVGGRVPERLRERAATRWGTASRVHYNRDLRFNSQSLIVATTERPSLGGRAWPTVVFRSDVHEIAFALWCNSTLGLLCHWWMSNKTQEGRGSTTVTGIPLLATLDVRALSDEQLAAAQHAFDSLAEDRFLPFDQIDEDSARAELDRCVLVDVLGLDPGFCENGGPIALLRRKLAVEPQVHADKRSRLVFIEGGEQTVARG